MGQGSRLVIVASLPTEHFAQVMQSGRALEFKSCAIPDKCKSDMFALCLQGLAHTAYAEHFAYVMLELLQSLTPTPEQFSVMRLSQCDHATRDWERILSDCLDAAAGGDLVTWTDPSGEVVFAGAAWLQDLGKPKATPMCFESSSGRLRNQRCSVCTRW